MILCTIPDAHRYSGLSPAMAIALEWLQNYNAAEFVKGVSVIGQCGDNGIIVKSEEPALLPREKARLEAHRRYIDIHVPLKGTEIMGWAPVSATKHRNGEFDNDNDITFFGDSAHSLLHVKVGQIAIFFPEDAHAPNIGLGNHRKLCIKVPVG